MYNALESLQAFELGTGQRKERERETAMKGVGNALAGGDYAGGAAQAFAIDPMYGMQIQQYGDQRNALATRQEIGGLVAAGDRAGASKLAYGKGEFEMGANIDAQIAQMTQQQRETALFISGQLGNAAMTLKGITDPSQRQAEWQQMQGYLTNELGIDPASLAQFNPMDDNDLTQAMGQAQSFSDRLAGQRWQAGFDQTEAQNKQDQENWQRAQSFSETDANRRFRLQEEQARAAAAEASGEGSGLNPALAGLPSGVQSAIVTKELGTLDASEANVGQARKAANLARTFMAEAEGYGSLGGGPLADIGQAASQKTASLKGVTAEMIPMMRQPGEGIMTDADAKRYESAVVSINKGRKANQRVVDDLERFERNEADRDAFLRAWQQQNGYGSVNQAKQVWMEYANANPIFDAETGKVNESRPDIFTWLNGGGDTGGATGLEDAAEEDLFYILRGE